MKKSQKYFDRMVVDYGRVCIMYSQTTPILFQDIHVIFICCNNSKFVFFLNAIISGEGGEGLSQSVGLL